MIIAYYCNEHGLGWDKCCPDIEEVGWCEEHEDY